MKCLTENKLFKSKLTPCGRKDIIVRLTTWCLLLFAVIAVCLVSGCRLFTFG